MNSAADATTLRTMCMVMNCDKPNAETIVLGRPEQWGRRQVTVCLEHKAAIDRDEPWLVNAAAPQDILMGDDLVERRLLVSTDASVATDQWYSPQLGGLFWRLVIHARRFGELGESEEIELAVTDELMQQLNWRGPLG